MKILTRALHHAHKLDARCVALRTSENGPARGRSRQAREDLNIGVSERGVSLFPFQTKK